MPYHLVKPPTSSLVGTTVTASAAVTGLGSTAALYVGQPVAGAGIPVGATVLTIDSPTQVALSVAATASATVPLSFGVEPLTLAEAKLHLSVEFTEADPLITRLITMAREDCESYLQRSLLLTSWELILDGFPYPWPDWNANGVIEIRRPPVQSVGDITYVDTTGDGRTLQAGVDFTVRALGLRCAPTRIYPASGLRWPATLPEPDVIRVPFVSGYGATADTVPAILKQGMLMFIEDKYKNRSATSDVANNAGEIPLGLSRLYAAEDWGARA